jgi:hypothetical protein
LGYSEYYLVVIAMHSFSKIYRITTLILVLNSGDDEEGKLSNKRNI